ncbi:MAG: hypothetical protein ACE5HA_18100, partial [Anaerolineae bacterium]
EVLAQVDFVVVVGRPGGGRHRLGDLGFSHIISFTNRLATMMAEGLLTEPDSPLRQAQDVARSGDLRRT